jgi:hypothetical protein
MAFLLPKTNAPKPPPAPAAPQRTDAEIAAAAAEQRRKLYQDAPGRRSTLGGGLDPVAPYVTASARLLGSGGMPPAGRGL